MQAQVKTLDFTGQNIYAGIDVHKKNWKVSIYTDELYHKTISQPPRSEELYRYLTKHFPNGTYYSVYEAGFCGFWIHEQLQSLGINSMVAHPADVPTTDREKKNKRDPIDSNKLARHLRSGNLDAIYIHERDIQEDRSLVRLRRTLSKELTRYKNRIKSKLYFFGINIPEEYCKDSSYWSKRFINWLENLELNRNTGTIALKMMINHVKTLRKDLLAVTRKIRELSQEKYYKNRTDFLLSIYGIGIITAMIILTEIDNIYRFNNLEKLAAYVGITPTSYSSGDKMVHGEMINRGNKYLKSAMIESAWAAARRDPVLHRDFINLSKRMKKNKAIIRIARKLLSRINFVLKNEIPYNNGLE
jgi:transposase